MQQDRPEWRAARLGKVTASRINDVMAKLKSGSGEAVTRRNYRAEKVLERLFGVPKDNGYRSPAMVYGSEWETTARSTYAWDNAVTVEESAFVDHPTIAGAGASPDGLIGEHGLVEIKCPEASAYLDAFMGKDIEGKYVLQMQWQMACTGRRWCDFVVWSEGCPIIVRRVHRDEKLIAEITAAVDTFLQEVEAAVAAAEQRK
jgi:putative phage-type endonuclease